jgi:hypothetical protein
MASPIAPPLPPSTALAKLNASIEAMRAAVITLRLNEKAPS